MIKVVEKNIVVREFNNADYTSFVAQLVQNPGWTNNFGLWNVKGRDVTKLFAYHLDGYKANADIKKNRFMYGVFTKQGLLIGECGFEYNETLNGVEFFVGLIEQARGRGYANEMVDAIKKIAKELGISKVNANIPAAHEIGIKLLEKAKFIKGNDFEVEYEGNTIPMVHYSYEVK